MMSLKGGTRNYIIDKDSEFDFISNVLTPD
jgi:hypothetical protein